MSFHTAAIVLLSSHQKALVSDQHDQAINASSQSEKISHPCKRSDHHHRRKLSNYLDYTFMLRIKNASRQHIRTSTFQTRGTPSLPTLAYPSLTTRPFFLLQSTTKYSYSTFTTLRRCKEQRPIYQDPARTCIRDRTSVRIAVRTQAESLGSEHTMSCTSGRKSVKITADLAKLLQHCCSPDTKS